MTDTLQDMTTTEFMTLYSSPYWHHPGLKASLDQGALGVGNIPRTGAPTGEAEAIRAERDRRALTYPQSWYDAGILRDPAGE